MNLEGRIAVVTGGAQGIGRACALVLAEAGADVAVADLNVQKLEAVGREIEAIGRKAMVLDLDVSSADSVKAGISKVTEAWKKIDILVNNAGVVRDNLLMRMKAEDWDAVLRINLYGAYNCIKEVLPGMVRQRYGRIVNLASVVAQAGNAGQANYIASKAGLIGLTKAVATEVARRNITVNAVAPGFIATAMTEKLPEDVREKMLAIIPVGRMGTDRDVAHAIKFLASEEAGYITGHVLSVNGGMYMA